MKELNSRFGSVCPLLKLSQHYGIDYTTVLMAADYMLHDRDPVGLSNDEIISRYEAVTSRPNSAEIQSETAKIVNWMFEQHAEAEQLEREGRLYFDPTTGKWAASPAINDNPELRQ